MDSRKRAAETILDRGVRFILPAPGYLRMFRLNRINVRPLRPGSILEISRVVVEHKLEESLMLAEFDQLSLSIEPICQCLAIAVLNGKWKIRLFKKILTKLLLWKFDTLQILEMFVRIKELNNVMDFMSITAFFCQQTQMMTNRNPGQEVSGR